jgi:hypothetical protein
LIAVQRGGTAVTVEHEDAAREEMAAIERVAAERTGLDDFGDRSFERPLLAWVRDLASPDINDFGRRFLRRQAVKDLCRRLKVLDYLARHPEIPEVELPPIVFITGGPRTGTTLLHNLMATHPLARPLLRWELMEPVPPPTPETRATDPRIETLRLAMAPLRGSRLEQMHWVEADDPEENAWGFLDSTGMVGRGVTALMPAWARWLEENDLASTYRDFRKVLQLLTWKCRPPPGGHLLLKCVMTSARVRDFAEAFPEASFVLTHRDPYRALVSTCATGDAICQPFYAAQPGALIKDGRSEQRIFAAQKRVLDALVEFSDSGTVPLANVRYADLMRDAVATTRSTYRALGMDVPEGLSDSIAEYLRAQRSGRRAAPPERLETYGYDADAVWRDPAAARYCNRFGVERERSRITDTRTGS